MKALKRKEGETVTEADSIPGIDWDTGMPLANPVWAGGPYTLVNDYDPHKDEENNTQPEQTKTEKKIVENDDYVIIEGKKYSKEELRSLLE